jgi:ATP-binding cassette subfamily B protein/subfamily B ATP-binding cassette protein MsbA
MRRFRSLIPYLVRQWPMLVVVLVLTGLSAAAGALQPWPMKLLVDYALSNAEVPSPLTASLTTISLAPTPMVLVLTAAVSSLVLYALNSALSVGLSLSWNLGGQRMVYDLAGELFARLQRLSLLFHSRRSVGDSLSRLTEDTWCIYTVADGLLMSPIQHVITLTVMICIGFALDPVLATLALAVAPLLALSSSFFGKRLKQRSKLGREAKSRLMSFVHQTLGAIPLVQTFGTESRNTKKFQELANDAVVLAQRGNLLGSSYGLVNGLITTTGIAVVLYVGGVRVLAGAIPLGTLLVFLAYVRRMQDASGGLFKIFTQLKAAEASVDRIMEVVESDDIIADPPHPVSLPDRSHRQRGRIRFENVSFGYQPSQPVLKGVTLEASPGEVVALVGPTGAGKSTLVSLIPRFFDPQEGQVTFDGVDLRNLKVADLRKQISIVLQEPFLMPFSVADNIAYGRPGASREEIVEAAIAAQADEFIRRLPESYDTVIGERGATLSGGERQRLAIARALLKDAPVLILDEPSSAIDVQTETSLIQAFQRLMEGRTTFIIAHRLSTIHHADRIAVLDHGRIVELGPHHELLEREGLYWQFHEHQFPPEGSKVVA